MLKHTHTLLFKSHFYINICVFRQLRWFLNSCIPFWGVSVESDTVCRRKCVEINDLDSTRQDLLWRKNGENDMSIPVQTKKTCPYLSMRSHFEIIAGQFGNCWDYLEVFINPLQTSIRQMAILSRYPDILDNFVKKKWKKCHSYKRGQRGPGEAGVGRVVASLYIILNLVILRHACIFAHLGYG